MEEPLAPPGNALRPGSLGFVALGFVALVVLMASDAHSALSVPLGLLAVALASFGLLDFAGCFDDPDQPGGGGQSLVRLRAPLLAVGGASLAWVMALRLAVSGVWPTPHWLAPLLVTSTAFAGVVALARLVATLYPSEQKLHQRAGFWLVLLGVALYLPLLGCYSLLDPWEPHYGEVAREMLARNDWISLWWAQEGWFWSKPALDFWLQGLCFALLGVNFRPDQMLSSAARGDLPQPEWAARLPVVLLTLVAVFALYRFVAAAAGKRAGFLAGLVLLCAPYWSLLAHQSMTDMPYVAPLTTALCAFGLGLLADAEQLAPSFTVAVLGRQLRISAAQGLFGLVLATGLPQLAYLVSRNVTLQLVAPPYGFRWHLDEFFSGSGLGNCGLPGNEACRGALPANTMFQPLLGAAIFGAALVCFLWLNRGERRQKRLYYQAAWYFTALSALGKGAPGLVLPVVVAGSVLVARRDWLELTRVELASFGLLLAAVCLPWYVQAYMRHGDQFTGRLLIHDMYKRAFVHVHDTNTGDDVSLRYYLWQLGYGLFPWTGLAPLGLGIALSRGSDEDRRSRDLALVLVLWVTLAFALFTLALTKFHHYALPCVPPLAVGVALVLDRALGERPLNGWRSLRFWDRRQATAAPDRALAVFALMAAPLTLLVARDLSTSVSGDVPGSARLLHLVTYNYKRLWPEALDFEAVQWRFGLAAAACLLLWLVPRLRALGSVLLSAVGVLFCAFTLWIYLPALAPHFGQREVILAYYQQRHGPEEPLVAYQMNWKGENFYSGNHLPSFVSTGAKFKKWLKAQRQAGTKIIYFVSEHGRIGTLKSELGTGFRAKILTDKALNNKFALTRVELTAEPSAASAE